MGRGEFMGQVTVVNNTIEFDHGNGDKLYVTLNRTLRLPEDGRKHKLPPSLGAFPLKRVEDYASRVPDSWRAHGGIFFPMWQREAMWVQFSNRGRATACKVAAGKINAVSGKVWTPELAPPDLSNGNDPRQDYMVTPPQQWIDGFNTGGGTIRQFVAMPLGGGHTVEAQVTGKEEFGGLQFMTIAAKAHLLQHSRSGSILRGLNFTLETQSFGAPAAEADDSDEYGGLGLEMMSFSAADSWSGSPALNNRQYGQKRRRLTKGAEMGLGQGGEIEQKIYPDPYGVDVWDLQNTNRLYVHIVNSELYRQITGELPPPSPITVNHYTAAGYPWFQVWDQELGDVQGSNTLANIKTVGQVDAAKSQFVSTVSNSTTVYPSTTVVKDGSW